MHKLNTYKDAARGARRSAPALSLVLFALLLLGTPAADSGKCTIERMQPELPVTMRDLRPLVHAQINGRDAMFIADSGSFFSLVGPATVREFHSSPTTWMPSWPAPACTQAAMIPGRY